MALADITGKSISQKEITRSDYESDVAVAMTMARPVVGTRLYEGEI